MNFIYIINSLKTKNSCKWYKLADLHNSYNFELIADEIALLYRNRWKIELFF